MNVLTVDASSVLPLAFEDEDNAYGQSVLDQAEAGTVLMAPSIWPAEIANVVLMAERRNRLDTAAASRFLLLLDRLPIELDQCSASHVMGTVLPLARRHGLTVYDALYLELAMRLGTVLATLDRKLRTAATNAGVPLL